MAEAATEVSTGFWGALKEEFLASEPLDFVLRATLVYLLIDELKDPWFSRVLVFLASGYGLLWRRHREPLVWGLLSAALAARVGVDWIRVDNHAWLTTYWCVAAWIATATREPGSLARSARLLVGLCMAFATIWKALLVDDFLAGDFFHWTFIWDGRFAELAAVLGRLDPSVLLSNRVLVEDQIARRSLESVTLYSSAVYPHLALVLAWLTIVIEGALAVGFLWPSTLRWRAGHPGEAAWLWWRDWLLIAFCWLTYILARVGPFGALLAMMGMAQCAPERRLTRLGYLSSFVVVFLYDWLPWRDWLLAIAGP